MITNDELKYIQAYSKIIGVKEGDAIEYAEKKGLPALVENASQLLSTPKQREKHQAFLELYRMSSALATRNPVISSPEATHGKSLEMRLSIKPVRSFSVTIILLGF